MTIACMIVGGSGDEERWLRATKQPKQKKKEKENKKNMYMNNLN